MAKIKHVGLRADRLRREPDEKRFADEWRKQNSFDPPLLAQMLGDGLRPSTDVTQRDAEVAATVIQWLGSHVGSHFVDECRKLPRARRVG